MSLYFALSSNKFSSNGAILAPSHWRRILCEKCRRFLPDAERAPITVQLSEQPLGLGGLVGGARVSVFHRDLFRQLEEHVGERHVAGPVVRADGREWPDYVSCYTTHPVYLRGARPTTTVFQRIARSYICAQCGWAHTLYAEPPRYLLSWMLDGRLMYQEATGSMFIEERVVDSIDWTLFPDAELEPILVLDRPLDGLRMPDEPDWSALPPPQTELNTSRPLIYRIEPWAVDDYFEPELLQGARGWTRAASRELLCTECKSIRPEWFPRPIEAVLARRPRRYPQPATRISRTGIPVLNTALAESLAERMPQLVLGSCRLADGTLLPEYSTCYAEGRLPIRAGMRSVERQCGTCGTAQVRLDHSARWALRDELGEHEVWLDPAGAILIPGHVALALDPEPWLGLRFWPVPIRDVQHSRVAPAGVSQIRMARRFR